MQTSVGQITSGIFKQNLLECFLGDIPADAGIALH